MSDVTWNSSTAIGFSISGNTVTDTTNNSSWDNWVQTTETLDDTEDNSAFFTTDSTNAMVGLAINPFNSATYSYQDIERCLHIESGSLEIFEGSTTTSYSFTHSSSTIYRIQLTSSGAKYYRDGTLFHTSTYTTDINVPHYLQVSTKVAGSTITATTDLAGSTPDPDPDPIADDGALPIEHILYLNTVVPR